MKRASVSVRIDENIKCQAEEILKNLGIPVSVLIDCLYRQIIETNGVPFPITVSAESQYVDTEDKVYIDVGGSHEEYLVPCPRVLSIQELHKELTPFFIEHVDTNVEKIANSYGVTYEQLMEFANGNDADISLIILNKIYWSIIAEIDVPWWKIPEKILAKWQLIDFLKKAKDEKGWSDERYTEFVDVFVSVLLSR